MDQRAKQLAALIGESEVSGPVVEVGRARPTMTLETSGQLFHRYPQLPALPSDASLQTMLLSVLLQTLVSCLTSPAHAWEACSLFWVLLFHSNLEMKSSGC